MNTTAYLDAHEVGERFGIHYNTVRRLYREGRFPVPVEIGNQLRWPKDILDAWERDKRAALERELARERLGAEQNANAQAIEDAEREAREGGSWILALNASDLPPQFHFANEFVTDAGVFLAKFQSDQRNNQSERPSYGSWAADLAALRALVEGSR